MNRRNTQFPRFDHVIEGRIELLQKTLKKLKILKDILFLNVKVLSNLPVMKFRNFFRKLNDSFGDCARPKVGWQIDPFGHSREMASIFAQLGFDGILLGRVDFEDKHFRMKTKTAEMIWRGSANLGILIFEIFYLALIKLHTKKPFYV